MICDEGSNFVKCFPQPCLPIITNENSEESLSQSLANISIQEESDDSNDEKDGVVCDKEDGSSTDEEECPEAESDNSDKIKLAQNQLKTESIRWGDMNKQLEMCDSYLRKIDYDKELLFNSKESLNSPELPTDPDDEEDFITKIDLQSLNIPRYLFDTLLISLITNVTDKIPNVTDIK